MGKPMGICYYCSRETEFPFRCPFCNLLFCQEHNLPEQHNCNNMPNRDWDTYRILQEARMDIKRIIKPTKLKPIYPKTQSRPSNLSESIVEKEYDGKSNWRRQINAYHRRRKIKKFFRWFSIINLFTIGLGLVLNYYEIINIVEIIKIIYFQINSILKNIS